VDATGRELLKIARQAWLSRHVDLVDNVAMAILALPLDPRIHNVARHYKALALPEGAGLEKTQVRFEELVDRVPPEFKSRILAGLGSCHNGSGAFDEAGRVYYEAGRSAANNLLSKCHAIRGMALGRSYAGDHEGSLADLERLFPVMRSFATSYPDDYCYYLNNLAYELGEVGRIDEASAAINVALRSPNAHRFPDWTETKQELESKRRRAFYPLTLAIGAPCNGSPKDEETNRQPPSDTAVASPLVLRSQPERAKRPYHGSIQISQNPLQSAFAAGHRGRWLAEIVEGVARFKSQAAVDATARQLVTIARQAWMSRDVEFVDQVTQALLTLPVGSRLQSIAQYYVALSQGFAARTSRYGLPEHWDSELNRILLERLADNVLPEYRARVLLGLANWHGSAGNLYESAKIHLEASRAGRAMDPLSLSSALRAIALTRSFNGDHKGSLEDLERVFPVMRSLSTSYPDDYRDYLNNLAYELGQVGRIDEAKAAITVALRSPHINRFRHWAETAQELETLPPRAFTPFLLAVGAPQETIDRAQSNDIICKRAPLEATPGRPVEPVFGRHPESTGNSAPPTPARSPSGPARRDVRNLKTGFLNRRFVEKSLRDPERFLSLAALPWSDARRAAIRYQQSSARAPPRFVETKSVESHKQTDRSVSVSFFWMTSLKNWCVFRTGGFGGSDCLEKATVELCTTSARAPPCVFSQGHFRTCHSAAVPPLIVRIANARSPPCVDYKPQNFAWVPVGFRSRCCSRPVPSAPGRSRQQRCKILIADRPSNGGSGIGRPGSQARRNNGNHRQ
jgi:tetratricopeptide (TPR) repeat protein